MWLCVCARRPWPRRARERAGPRKARSQLNACAQALGLEDGLAHRGEFATDRGPLIFDDGPEVLLLCFQLTEVHLECLALRRSPALLRGTSHTKMRLLVLLPVPLAPAKGRKNKTARDGTAYWTRDERERRANYGTERQGWATVVVAAREGGKFDIENEESKLTR